MTREEAIKAKTDGDTISRQAAIDECDKQYPNIDRQDFKAVINAVPSAEPKTGRDCTDFVRWLMGEVMDEENWQLNAVANGEIICRKLKKLGLLDVVDGYYVEMQKTGEWIEHEDPYGFFDTIPVCSECGHTTKMRERYNYCPNCGSYNGGEEE